MKKLYLSSIDKKIFGVCGGIAHYFGIDSTMIRLGCVFLALVSFGALVLFYLIAWILIPKEPGDITIDV